MTERQVERLIITIAAVIIVALFLWAANTEQTKAANCQEDEDWVVVDYQDARGVEDMHGVTRACVHHEN